MNAWLAQYGPLMVALIVLAALGVFALHLRMNPPLSRTCFHHDHRRHVSWIKSNIIDAGRKVYWCTKCEKRWVL